MTDDTTAHSDGTTASTDDPDSDESTDSQTSPSEEELRKQGRREASRQFDKADGHTPGERAVNAYETLQSKFKDTTQNHKRAVNRQKEIRSRLDRLTATRDRLREIHEDPDDDRLLLRTREGGITEEIRPDEVSETIDRIETEVESLKEQYETVTEEVDRYERLRMTLQYALKESKRKVEDRAVSQNGPDSSSRPNGRPNGQR
jgi:chromosome segregation ATPase